MGSVLDEYRSESGNVVRVVGGEKYLVHPFRDAGRSTEYAAWCNRQHAASLRGEHGIVVRKEA